VLHARSKQLPHGSLPVPRCAAGMACMSGSASRARPSPGLSERRAREALAWLGTVQLTPVHGVSACLICDPEAHLVLRPSLVADAGCGEDIWSPVPPPTCLRADAMPSFVASSMESGTFPSPGLASTPGATASSGSKRGADPGSSGGSSVSAPLRTHEPFPTCS
jgi:hypothetical protein